MPRNTLNKGTGHYNLKEKIVVCEQFVITSLQFAYKDNQHADYGLPYFIRAARCQPLNNLPQRMSSCLSLMYVCLHFLLWSRETQLFQPPTFSDRCLLYSFVRLVRLLCLGFLNSFSDSSISILLDTVGTQPGEWTSWVNQPWSVCSVKFLVTPILPLQWAGRYIGPVGGHVC